MRILIASILLFNVLCASAAEMEIVKAQSMKGDVYRIEGEILPGDYDKLWRLFMSVGPELTRVTLDSKGGDANEAMKIGRLLRRLRMHTFAPMHFTGREPLCGSKLSDDRNCVCASACFLVFAGGSWRAGNVLVLHRPHLSATTAAKVTSTEHEELQVRGAKSIRQYLDEMEIPSYYADLMMSRNSETAYVLSAEELNGPEHLLLGWTPSIEEITISRCRGVANPTEREYYAAGDIARKGSSATSRELAFKEQILDRSNAHAQCQTDAETKMRAEAFSKEFGDKAWWGKPK